MVGPTAIGSGLAELSSLRKVKSTQLIGGCVLTWSKRRLRNVWRLGKEWKWTVVDKQVSATVSCWAPALTPGCRLVRCWLEELEKLNNLPIWPIFSSVTYNTFYRIKNVFKKYFEDIFLTLFMRTTTEMFSLSCKVTVVSWFNRLLSPVSHAVSSLEPKLAKNTNDLTGETSDLCGA